MEIISREIYIDHILRFFNTHMPLRTFLLTDSF